MSGSIGASRIPTKSVKNTLSNYNTQVLFAVKGYKEACPTGSFVKYYNTRTEKEDGHGDIDLVVYVKPKEGESLQDVKRRFVRTCEILDDSVTVPFTHGKNIGKKVQMYGDIITVQYPICKNYPDEEQKYVQIDNMIVTNEKEYYFMQQFLSLPAIEQSLITASMRVVPTNEIIKFFTDMGLSEVIPQNIEENQRLEIVIGTRQWSLRLVTLDENNKEIKKKRQVLFSNSSIAIFNYMIHYFYLYNVSYVEDFQKDYTYILEHVYDKYKDYHDANVYFNRIIGILKSICTVKPGEVGTLKEVNKMNSIAYCKNYFNYINGNK